MTKVIPDKKSMFIHFSKEEQKTYPINLKVTPTQAKRWKEMTEEFGVDLSTFIRGAVESAIFNSLRAKDSQWQKFIEAIQPTAVKILGHGFYDGGVKDFEAGGTERKGTPAMEFLEELSKKNANKSVDLKESGEVNQPLRVKTKVYKTAGFVHRGTVARRYVGLKRSDVRVKLSNKTSHVHQAGA